MTTSADFGHGWMIQIFYADGASTFHGIFDTESEAYDWLEERLTADYKDSRDGAVLVINKVA